MSAVFALILLIFSSQAQADFCQIKDELSAESGDNYLPVYDKAMADENAVERVSIRARLYPGYVVNCPNKVKLDSKATWLSVGQQDTSESHDKEIKESLWTNALRKKYVTILKDPPPLYWNAPEGHDSLVPLARHPGLSDYDCNSLLKNAKIESTGRSCDFKFPKISAQTKFTIKEAKMIRHEESEGEFKTELYYRVDVSGGEESFTDRWVPASALTDTPVQSVTYKRTEQKSAEKNAIEAPKMSRSYEPWKPSIWTKEYWCDLRENVVSHLKSATEDIFDRAGAPRPLPHLLSDAEHSQLGSCLAPQLKNKDHKHFPKGDNFNKFLVAKWVPEINAGKTYNGQFDEVHTARQMYAIDAVARTLYGEMRGACTNIGEHYMKGIGRVMLNRAEYVQIWGNGFAPQNEKLLAEDLERIYPYVVGSGDQFNVWHDNDNNLDDGLCPDRDSHSWQVAQKVAEEMLLQRDKFKDETRDITVYHYTSAITPRWKYPLVKPPPTVMGDHEAIPLKESACVRFWDGSKKDFHKYDPEWGVSEILFADPAKGLVFSAKNIEH